MMLRTTLGLGLCGLLLASCVSNKTVRTVETRDYSLTCGQLQFELAELGTDFEDAKDDSGITGKNIGLAVVFWPGILVNEARAYKNQDSIDDRIDHLTTLYVDQCVAANTAQTSL